MIAGTFARLSGLGGRPLAVDEYYFTRSVGFVLETGLPEFPSGGYYTRGLLPQYLSALSILIFRETGLAYRLPTTLFGFLGVALGYAYCRRHLDRRLALAVACALLVSSWQVEFARFARMYAIFQCFTLVMLIAFDEAYFRGRRHFRYAPHAAGIALALSHSLSILLVPLLLIPLIDPRMRSRFASLAERVRFALAGLTLLALSVFLATADLRNSGVMDRLPLDYVAGPGMPPIVVPAFPFWQIGGSATATLLAVVALLGGMAALALLWARRRARASDGRTIGLGAMVLAAVLHQFVVAGVLVWALVCRHDLWRIARQPVSVYLAVLAAGALVAGWLGYAFSRHDWTADVDGPQMGLVWSLRRTFFGWPDFYSLGLIPWAANLPWMGLLILASLAYMSFRTLKEPNGTLLRRPWVVLAYVMVCFGVLRSEYSELRYWFFIYPVILCVIATAFQDVASRLGRGAGVAAIAYLATFGLSGDFQPRHLADIASHQAAYRIGPYQGRDGIWYGRQDFASPARYVGARAGDQRAGGRGGSSHRRRRGPGLVLSRDRACGLSRPPRRHVQAHRPRAGNPRSVVEPPVAQPGRRRRALHRWRARGLVDPTRRAQAATLHRRPGLGRKGARPDHPLHQHRRPPGGGADRALRPGPAAAPGRAHRHPALRVLISTTLDITRAGPDLVQHRQDVPAEQLGVLAHRKVAELRHDLHSRARDRARRSYGVLGCA